MNYVDIPDESDPRHTRRFREDSPEAIAYQQRSTKQHPGFSSPLLTQEGPGTELKRLLESLGITNIENCSCRAKMEEMNRIGIAQCRERREEIAGWLRDGQSQFGWSVRLAAAVKAARVVPAEHWLDPFQWMVDEATRRAEDGSPGPTAR